jgi:hypothetical protein
VPSPHVKEGCLHNSQVAAGVPKWVRFAKSCGACHRPPVWISDLGLTPLVAAAKMTLPKLGVGCSVPLDGPLSACA